ncbi:reticulon-like protein B8 isoform X2 [Argentina anserina]|uniref:reticulon-like protein B8 isoform X2 n=1 Tax=Argentina anserina TaxID=57926 RepID=UPI00217642B3|nr:reticulon-like protein B8 isoform X2 [Potentilla anserina]
MEVSHDLCSIEEDGDGEKAMTSTSYPVGASEFRLFGRQGSVHDCFGGGSAADVLLWRRRRVSIGAIVAATLSWLLFERSGLSCLSVCSDILLILVVWQFLRANYAVFRNKWRFVCGSCLSLAASSLSSHSLILVQSCPLQFLPCTADMKGLWISIVERSISNFQGIIKSWMRVFLTDSPEIHPKTKTLDPDPLNSDSKTSRCVCCCTAADSPLTA